MNRNIYFAGGCFWGTERVFKEIPGVVDTTVGYANGTVEYPSYRCVGMKPDTERQSGLCMIQTGCLWRN